MQSDILTVADVARQFGVSEPTIRAWERLGKLAARRTRSGIRLFAQADVDQLQAQRNAMATKELEEGG